MSAYYACFDRNLTATGCLPLSLCVPLRELEPYKSAVLSPPVSPCPPVSLKENDYESEGRRFESCRARFQKPCKSRSFATVYRVNSYEHAEGLEVAFSMPKLKGRG